MPHSSLDEHLARVPDGPLYGTLVVAFDQQIAGSLAAEELARQGATVIKVERADIGDPKRANSSPTTFNTFNAGKYSISFSTSVEDQALKRRLLDQADVIIDNRSEEAQLRDSILQEKLSRTNAKPIIYCAISGFGRGARIPAYDRVVQAASGMADLNNGLVTFPVIDMATGKEAAKDIVAHLFWLNRLNEQERCRAGTVRLDVSMVDVAMSLMGNVAARYYDEKETHSSLVPFGLFNTSDGKIAIATAKDDQYARLCYVLGMPEHLRHHITNAERQQHQQEIESEMQNILAQQSSSHWIEALERENVPVQPVMPFSEAFQQYGLPLMQVDGESGIYVGNPTHSNAFPRNAPRIGGAPTLNGDRNFVGSLVGALEAGELLDQLLRNAHRNEDPGSKSGFYSKFKWVDPKDIDWSKGECQLPWAKSHVYRVAKTAPVYAEKAREGDILRTSNKEQDEITTNIAARDDWKITTMQGDQYFLSERKFREIYNASPDAENQYWPRPCPPRQAVTVTENIRFHAPWGKVQYIPKGGLIIRRSDTDIYGIHPENVGNFTRSEWVEKIGFMRRETQQDCCPG